MSARVEFIMCSDWELGDIGEGCPLVHRNKCGQERLEALHSKVVLKLEKEVAYWQAQLAMLLRWCCR